MTRKNKKVSDTTGKLTQNLVDAPDSRSAESSANVDARNKPSAKSATMTTPLDDEAYVILDMRMLEIGEKAEPTGLTKDIPLNGDSSKPISDSEDFSRDSDKLSINSDDLSLHSDDSSLYELSSVKTELSFVSISEGYDLHLDKKIVAINRAGGRSATAATTSHQEQVHNSTAFHGPINEALKKVSPLFKQSPKNKGITKHIRNGI